MLHKFCAQEDMDRLYPDYEDQVKLFRDLGNLCLASAVAAAGSLENASNVLKCGSHQFLCHLADYHAVCPVSATSTEVDEGGNTLDRRFWEHSRKFIEAPGCSGACVDMLANRHIVAEIPDTLFVT